MINDDLLILLRIAVMGSEVSNNFQNSDWQTIYKVSCRNNIASIIYETITKIPKSMQPDPNLMNIWKKSAFMAGLHQCKQYGEMRRILSELSELEIKPVIFKGPALAALYPDPLMRLSSDVDILIQESDRNRLINYLDNSGFELMDTQWGGEVLVYSLKSGLTIEFHFRLWEGYHGSRIKILEELGIDKQVILTNCCGFDFYTFEYSAHLLYQIYHIVKHFSLEGVNLRYLADITLYVNAFKDKINFTALWSILQKLKYDEFSQVIFTICSDYLGMNNEAINPHIKVNQEVINDILDDIMNGGNMYESDNESWSTLNIIKPYIAGNKRISSNPILLFVSILFPSRSKLVGDYKYLEKYPIFLPIAWFERALHHLFNKKEPETLAKIKKAKKRLILMQKTKLIKG